MVSIIAAAITGILTLVGVIVANLRSQAVLGLKIDKLSKRVDKQNEVLERTYALGCDMTVVKSELKGTGRECSACRKRAWRLRRAIEASAS